MKLVLTQLLRNAALTCCIYSIR